MKQNKEKQEKVYENENESKRGIFMPAFVTLAITHFNSFYKLNKCLLFMARLQINKWVDG